MRRRIFLFLISFFAVTIAFSRAAEDRDKILSEKADLINRILWSRFIGPAGIMYDYIGTNGEIVLPTPEECEKNIPNALGWWSPIENGGFFNGMYLISQCMRYERDPTSENREKVERLVAGLLKLQDVGSTPGFIARGVGADGKCHYVASSDDQNFPFVLGLWRYLKTNIPPEEKRKEIFERIVRHVETLRSNRWLIVGERPDFVRGNWLKTDYHSAVHMITTVKIMVELTGKDEWKAFYADLLREDDPLGAQRRKNIRSGPKDLAGWSAWFYGNCQYSVRELYRTEKDPDLKQLYRESLFNTGQSAKKLIRLYKNYDRDNPGTFTPDWRRMMPPYRPQKNGDEAVQLALEQLRVWNRACPAIEREKATLKPSICAAWIVALSENDSLIDASLPEIVESVGYFDYSKMHYAAFFFVENLVETLKEHLEKNLN